VQQKSFKIENLSLFSDILPFLGSVIFQSISLVHPIIELRRRIVVLVPISMPPLVPQLYNPDLMHAKIQIRDIYRHGVAINARASHFIVITGRILTLICRWCIREIRTDVFILFTVQEHGDTRGTFDIRTPPEFHRAPATSFVLRYPQIKTIASLDRIINVVFREFVHPCNLGTMGSLSLAFCRSRAYI
jgi:hypothetical protein